MLWLRLNFLKECSACVFDEISHSQARTVGTLRDPRVHKPRIHRVWGVLHALRTKLNRYTTNLGPVTKALLEKETDGRQWYNQGDRDELKSILAAAVIRAGPRWAPHPCKGECRVATRLLRLEKQ